MKATLIVLACVLAVASAASIPITDCGSHHVKATDVSISPDHPKANDDLVVTVSASADADLASGTLHINLKYLGISIYKDNPDVCSLVEGGCPIKAGSFQAVYKKQLPAILPHGKYAIEVTGDDSIQTGDLCVSAEMDITSAKAVEVAFAPLASAWEQEAHAQFLAFQTKYGKKYTSAVEYGTRFNNFKVSLNRIQARQALEKSATFGITKFSDLSVEEFKRFYLGYKPSGDFDRLNHPVLEAKPVETPSSFDWRSKNAVTPVKNQEQCGSCWAFSATEEIESMWILSGKPMVELSPQQIVSCDHVDAGCNGGDTPTAYKYVEGAGGIESSKDYPYTSGGGNSGKCKFNKSKVVADLKGFKYATPPCTGSCANQDEKTMASNMASTGPVSICVYAESWMDYTSGVLTSNCPKSYDSLDHCVQATGFDTSASTPYWAVRNSWGTNWGIDGYIHIEFGKNLCGIADEATIVEI